MVKLTLSKWTLRVKDSEVEQEFDTFLLKRTVHFYYKILVCQFTLIVVSAFQFLHLNDFRPITTFTGIQCASFLFLLCAYIEFKRSTTHIFTVLTFHYALFSIIELLTFHRLISQKNTGSINDMKFDLLTI